MTIYVAPNNVSDLVVYTLIGSSEESLIEKLISTPSDFPIQFFWSSLIFSGQSKSSSPFNKDSAYLVIFNTHCFIGVRYTGCPPISDFPSTTSSFASTARSSGHQLTATSSW